MVHGLHPLARIGLLGRWRERDIHFDTMYDGQGASMALPIWALYMNKVYADKSLGYDQTERFKLPEGIRPLR